MAIKVNSIKCPECNAALPIEEGRTQVFCSYCGAKVVITNENEYIFRNIDEAQIRQAEADQTVQLKKLEIIERKWADAVRTKKIKIIVSIAMGIIGVILMLTNIGTAGPVGLLVLEGALFIWLLSSNSRDTDIDLGDKVRVPSSISDYENKNYAAIESAFLNAGFTNVRCVPLNDLRMGLLKKPGMVESITIKDKQVTSGGRKFSPDSPVLISYHSFPDWYD